jgi:hypothetical protein
MNETQINKEIEFNTLRENRYQKEGKKTKKTSAHVAARTREEHSLAKTTRSQKGKQMYVKEVSLATRLTINQFVRNF